MKSFVIIFVYNTVTKIDLIDYSRTMKLDYLLIVIKRTIIQAVYLHKQKHKKIDIL